jgi:6-phosphogluconolactonase (cycloisomerase 2 family)
VYVLDAGTSNIAGFVNLGGHLVALPGSTQPLSGAGTSPEEISFSPDGGWLVVTELGTNYLVTYRVGFLGIAGAPSVYSPNRLAGLAGPYGFAFDNAGQLFVTEAGTSALSSYALSPTGVPSVISGSVVNGLPGVCWVALTPDGRYAFTIDAHAAAVSSYAIAPNGSLTLINKTAATMSAPALDASVSGDGRFLYVVDVGTNTIDAFRIGPGASLSLIVSTSPPAGAAVGGLAAS